MRPKWDPIFHLGVFSWGYSLLVTLCNYYSKCLKGISKNNISYNTICFLSSLNQLPLHWTQASGLTPKPNVLCQTMKIFLNFIVSIYCKTFITAETKQTSISCLDKVPSKYILHCSLAWIFLSFLLMLSWLVFQIF